MIDLYGDNTSNVLKVLIALEELKLPYRLHHVNLMKNEQYAPEFEALTPNRKVPLIVDEKGPGGAPLTLWESGAILIYLGEKADALIPADAAARYMTMQWLMFQMASVGPMFGQYNHFKLWVQDQPYSLDRYATQVDRAVGTLEARLAEAPWLAGPDYSIADIAVWPWLRAPEAKGIDPGAIPNIMRWFDAIRQRPAVAKASQRIEEFPRAELKPTAENQEQLDRMFGRGRYARNRDR